MLRNNAKYMMSLNLASYKSKDLEHKKKKKSSKL